MQCYRPAWAGLLLKAGAALLITALPIAYTVKRRHRRDRKQTAAATSQSIELPYFAADPPSPLPTIAEINAATPIIDHNGWKVVKIDTAFVVKYGCAKQPSLIEGENMLFVQQNTRVKVPRVYALYHDSELSQNYIVMEYIEGNSLESQWACLTHDERSDIAATLTGYFIELRSLPAPGTMAVLGGDPFCSEFSGLGSLRLQSMGHSTPKLR